MPCRHGALSSGMPKATALTRRRMPLSSVTHSSGFAGVTLGTRGAALCLFSWGSSAVDLRCRSSFRSSAPVGIREVLRVEVAQAAAHRLRGDRVEQRRRSVTGRGGGQAVLQGTKPRMLRRVNTLCTHRVHTEVNTMTTKVRDRYRRGYCDPP